MLLVLFVVLFTCGDGVIGGVKRAIERAFEAAGTGGASSSARVACVRFGWWSAAVPLKRGSSTGSSVVKLAALLGGRADVQCVGARARGQRCFAHGMEGAASVGHGGRQPKNLHRDLMTLFGTPRGAPAFHVATHPDAKCAPLPPSSLAARVLLRTLRALTNLAETILTCQERAGGRQFRWACMAMQTFSRSRTAHSSFLGTHCWVLPRTKVSDGGGSSQ